MPPEPSNKKIGMFDSGVGGLTLVSQTLLQMPDYKIVYFGDTANVPYGDKTNYELINLAGSITSFLIEKGVRAVVDACNSTSSVALDFLQENYDVPIVGVIQAGVREALEKTRNGRIGVIATNATVRSNVHAETAKMLDPEVKVFSQACPNFVPLIEAGKTNGIETRLASEKYLSILKEKKIDTLILGCTHYPFLAPVIKYFLSDNVTLVDPAAGTIRELKKIMGENRSPEDVENSFFFKDHEYYVSGNPTSFKKVGEKLAGQEIGEVFQAKVLDTKKVMQ